MPPIRIIGRKTMATMTMPTPPNHCRSARQSSIPLGASSRPEKTVAPVVVSPDIASK